MTRKKALIFAIINLAVTLVFIALIVLILTHESHARNDYVNSVTDSGQRVGEGIASIVILISMFAAILVYLLAVSLMLISWIGLFATKGRGFAIVGIVGKVISLFGLFLVFALTESSFSKVFYPVVFVLIIVNVILDIIFLKRGQVRDER